MSLVGAAALATLSPACARGPAPAAPPVCPDRAISVAFYEFGALYRGGSGERSEGFEGSGIDVDLMRELKRRSGCRFEGSVMTRARIWSELEGGRLDMTTSGIATPEREKLYAFAPYILLKHNVWMLASHAPVPGGLAEFMANPKLRWGAVRGYKHTADYDAALDAARAQGRVVEATDDAALLRLLAEGSVDAVIGHGVVMRRYAAEHPRRPELVSLDWAPRGSVVPEGLVLSRARFGEAEIAAWRRLVWELVRDGTLARIARRHVPEDEVPDLIPRDDLGRSEGPPPAPGSPAGSGAARGPQ
jgi:polar amino acid transport system substrate-binding protein